MKEITIVTIMALCLAGLIYCVYWLIRNHRVHTFRMWIINNRIDLYPKLPDYDEMLFNGKPLKLESYFTKEEINP